MNQYHIKVNKSNCAEILNKLGAIGYGVQFPKIDCDEFSIFTYEDGGIKFITNQYVIDRANWAVEGMVDLSEDKLNDLVVLQRNDVNDANHRDKQHKSIYLTSDQTIYYWDGEWLNSAINKSNDYENYIANSLTPISKNEDVTLIGKHAPEFKTLKVEGLEGLIDGKAALTAALAGETVQITFEPWEEKSWENFNPLEDELSTKIFFTGMSTDVRKVFFRIKPKTILINSVEVPAPFTPKNGDTFFYLSGDSMDGVHKAIWNDERCSNVFLGVWPSKDQVLKVIAVLKDLFEVRP
ncbi:TPA: hypothetical protein ACF2EK_000858 [Acinetobacter baumannii]